ncbi:MAG TPA: hypothetical protein VIM58_10130, partial [Candidatus Methylacidiphilales bacterium]
SAAPWRVLDRKHARLCLEAARLHVAFGKEILASARHAAKTGEPMVRSLAYACPGLGYEEIADQFLLGNRLLVAPVLEKGAASRRVVLPPGQWRADDGRVYPGAAAVEIEAPLERLPRFVRVDGARNR